MKLISTTKSLQTRKCPMTRFQSLPFEKLLYLTMRKIAFIAPHCQTRTVQKSRKKVEIDTSGSNIRHNSHGKGKIPHSSGHIPGVCLGRGCLCFHLVILVNLISPFHYLHSYFNWWIGSFGACDSGDSRDFRVAHELLSYQLISGLISY